ncbi:N-acetylglucosamine kinase [Wukongibacter sp. M2B1]|uniref:N-acetylglucosamine kinase n=1 Tax=Wukongibacter sp. M2B1 TaxID=3088895 RepID=UPI003D7B1B2C
MQYYIGIDGGGTKTLAYLGNEKKNIIEAIEVGSTNYHSVGIEKVRLELQEIFKFFIESQDITIEKIKGICIGGAGIDCKSDEKAIEKVFRDIGYKNVLQIYNDSVIALVGANGSKRGAILVSGTGSIAFGIDKNGEKHRVGGWGHIIDDAGSGYAIARDGLKKIMESYDGREEDTKIWQSIKDKLNLSHIDELITFIYDTNTKKHDIAKLAPCIIDLYEIDRVANRVIDIAVKDLCSMIDCLAKKMKEEDFSLGLSGSIFLKSEIIRKLFIQEMKKIHSDIRIHLPKENAVMGALALATEEYRGAK